MSFYSRLLNDYIYSPMKMPYGGRSSSTSTDGETLSPEALCAGFRVWMKHLSVLGGLKIWYLYKSAFFEYLSIYAEERLSTAGVKHRRKTTESRAWAVLLRSKHFSAVPKFLYNSQQIRNPKVNLSWFFRKHGLKHAPWEVSSQYLLIQVFL